MVTPGPEVSVVACVQTVRLVHIFVPTGGSEEDQTES